MFLLFVYVWFTCCLLVVNYLGFDCGLLVGYLLFTCRVPDVYLLFTRCC